MVRILKFDRSERPREITSAGLSAEEEAQAEVRFISYYLALADIALGNDSRSEESEPRKRFA